MYITHKKGQIAVCEIQRRALEKDVVVCIPTTEQRYDLIIEENNKLYKVQSKYVDAKVNESSGSVCLDFRKECRNNGKKRVYNDKEIDVVLAYLPKIKKVLWLGPEIFHNKGSITLRYELPKNNQKNGITMVDDLIW